MKKSDMAMIVLIASISMMIAYFVAQALIGNTQSESVQVKTADRIDTTITQPDTSIFNSNAINPTVPVIIGGQSSGSSSSNSTGQ